MRRLLAPVLALATLVTACTEQDPAPVYVEVDYQVRCLDCMPRAQDDPRRDIAALDQENDFRVSCTVAQVRGEPAVTFTAAFTDPDPEREARNYSIRVTQATLSGDPGSSCRVRVEEGPNTYEGRCTSDEPTDDEPCQVDLSEEDGIITGSVLCVHIPNALTTSVTRHVVAPGTMDEPAEFEVHGCPL